MPKIFGAFGPGGSRLFITDYDMNCKVKLSLRFKEKCNDFDFDFGEPLLIFYIFAAFPGHRSLIDSSYS